MIPKNIQTFAPDEYIGQQMQYDSCITNNYGNHSINETIKYINNALEGETEDKVFYEQLIKDASNDFERDIIKGIRDDELKHYKMFRQLYYELTGQMPVSQQNYSIDTVNNYEEGLKKAILGEQKAVESYRKILFLLQDKYQTDKIVEIITDEIRHGILYNLLFSSNIQKQSEE
jgi:rubrerythrin